MEYNFTKDGKWRIISVNGSINFEAANELHSVFEKVLSEGEKFVRLNLKKVPVSNSSGISAILVLYRNLKKRDGMLEIKGISKNLAEMFRLLKIDRIIKIEDEESAENV
ncbi:MAG: STAS domain-containing protein [Spirochaetes bacterium]|nr:STAS domain-containing protein [Spirochaetota bacterium]